MTYALFALLALDTGAALSVDAFPAGAVIDEIQFEGYPAHRAGLRPGDRLLSWLREAASEGGRAGGQLLSPFELADLAMRELVRGPLTVNGTREGIPFTAALPADGDVGAKARPAFPESQLQTYERGRILVAEGKLDEGTALWRELAALAARTPGGTAASCWLLGRIGSVWAKSDVMAVRSAYRDAVECARQVGPHVVSALLQDRYWIERLSGQLQAAEEVSLAAIETVRSQAGFSLAEAAWLTYLGDAVELGRGQESVHLFHQALSLQTAEAPEGVAVAGTGRPS
jgi:hypothetical protein